MIALAVAMALSPNPGVEKRTASAAPAEKPYDFQGTVLGMPLAEWRASHPDGKCRPGRIEGETACEVEKPAFLKVYGSLEYRFYAADGAASAPLYEINLNAADVNETSLYDGVVGKWGKPASFSVQIDSWRRGGSTIRFMRLFPGVAVVFSLDAVDATIDAAKKAKAAASF